MIVDRWLLTIIYILLMNNRLIFCFLVLMCLGCADVMWGASTTYVFNSLKWGSMVGSVKCDGKSDGWISDADASEYNAGRTDAAGLLYSKGVGVKTGTSGAGATSVIDFKKVRKVIVNFCQNASKGKGQICVSVGGSDALTIPVTRPETSGAGVYNRDVELDVEELSGKIRFWVDCTENGIYINSITIKADNGSPNNPDVSSKVFRLVTDASTLNDGDKVIFGVAKEGVNKMMGLYDDMNSKNNIYAISASYGADRQTINAKEEGIYTLEKVDGGWAFVDYYGWYLVASGGNPNRSNNNYLTVWDNYVSENYGDYGVWDVSITQNGEATVKSKGNSRSNIIQYNPNLNNNKPLFACYESASYTPIALYRMQEDVDDGTPMITANFVDFGTQLLGEEGNVSGQKTIEVAGMNLTDDINASLKLGKWFSLSKNVLDRDGEQLTVGFSADECGEYCDTLVLTSGETKCEVSVLLKVARRISIAEAKTLGNLSMCYLNNVSVTKKYNRYIFVKDETGAMMIYDAGNEYGQGLKNGNVLTGVSGYMKDYYGNPELMPTSQFGVEEGPEIEPEEVSTLSADDVCRYVRLRAVESTADGKGFLLANGEEIPYYDIFNYVGDWKYYGVNDVEGIVYFYDKIVLCPTEINEATGIENVNGQQSAVNGIFNLAGQRVGEDYRGVVIKSGKKSLKQ